MASRLKIRIAAFIFVGVLLLVGVCVFSNYILRSSLNDKVFRFGSNIDTIIAGDSHPMCSVDPEILERAENVSAKMENYFYTYYKLKHFLDSNPGIKNVILGYSYHNLSKAYEEGMLFDPERFDDDRVFANQEMYFMLLNDEGKDRIKSIKREYFINYLKYDIGIPFRVYKDKYFIKKILGRELKRHDYEFYGGFYSALVSKIDKKQIEDNIIRHYYENNSYGGVSGVMQEYLVKIIQMCSEKKIKVYLFNAPLYSYYREKVPKAAISDYEKISRFLLSRYPGLRIVDLAGSALDETHFIDGHHLNAKGARIASRILREIVRRDDSGI
jgi:hypothetical protein